MDADEDLTNNETMNTIINLGLAKFQLFVFYGLAHLGWASFMMRPEMLLAFVANAIFCVHPRRCRKAKKKFWGGERGHQIPGILKSTAISLWPGRFATALSASLCGKLWLVCTKGGIYVWPVNPDASSLQSARENLASQQRHITVAGGLEGAC